MTTQSKWIKIVKFKKYDTSNVEWNFFEKLKLHKCAISEFKPI